MALPRVRATLVIANGGNTGMGAIISFMLYCLLRTKFREEVSFNEVAVVIPFYMKTEIGTRDGIIF